MRVIGIDLGTTNSVLAESESENGKIKTRVIDIDRQEIRPGDRIRTSKRRNLLPSVACKDKSGSWTVGDYAQKMLQKKPAYVAKSVKRHMDQGSERFEAVGGISWTPIEVSTQILIQLIRGAQYIWRYAPCPDHLAITVPASFRPSMIKATIQAANKAIQAANKAKLTIPKEEITTANLLYEPRAALCQFSNTPPVENIDFSEKREKLFLVFDLGGGTLDVSLHKVLKENGRLTIKEDIAISPYNRFGGDDFDKLVAQSLLEEYPPYNKSSSLKPYDQKLLELQFQEQARLAKESLSVEAPKFPIIITPKDSDGKELEGFSHDLNLSDYQKIVEPLLAPNLCFGTNHAEKWNQDIINPILHVLDEAKKKLGSCAQPNVDVILLSGGMTRLNIIRERLEKFFKKHGHVIPEGELDPETAVAQGAALYCIQEKMK